MPHRLRQALRGLVLCLALGALCAVGASADSLGTGTVTTDALRLRSQPNTSSAILTMVNAGTRTDVLSRAENGWYKVSYKGTEGYMSAEYVTVEWTVPAKGRVDAQGATLNVRSGPGTGYLRIGSLSDGATVAILDLDQGWYHIQLDALTGYVSADYLLPVEETAPAPKVAIQTTPLPAAEPTAQPDPADQALPVSDEPTLPPEAQEGVSAKGQEVVDFAKTLLGSAYVYGASGPNSFDCSGFVYYVFRHFDVTLNRGATGQLSNGTAIERSQLRPGDLVFFFDGKVSTPVSHVGIYIGGDEFIHASTNSYEVVISSMAEGTTYDRNYVYARRIFD